MKKLLLIIPLVLSIVACSEREIDTAKIQNRNGVFYAVNEDRPYSGKMIGFHPNGQLSSETTIVNGEVNGVAYSWYENGQLLRKATYVNGKADGVIREWDENGQLAWLATVVNGKADGVSREWHENGHLSYEAYYVNGQLVSETSYDNGEIIE